MPQGITGSNPVPSANFQNSDFGRWLKSELFLTKIRTANFDAPPRRHSLTLATPQKSFLHIFYFARPRFFLLKGKENFFAGLCSERAGRRGFASASGQKFLPPDPLPFCPLTFGLRPIFCGRAIIKIRSRPCPTAPVRGRQKGTPLKNKNLAINQIIC